MNQLTNELINSPGIGCISYKYRGCSIGYLVKIVIPYNVKKKINLSIFNQEERKDKYKWSLA